MNPQGHLTIQHRLTSHFAVGFLAGDDIRSGSPIMKAFSHLANSRTAMRRILVVAMLLCALEVRAYPSEPESHGHPLSYWLEHWMPVNSAEDRKMAETAIREIGTN